MATDELMFGVPTQGGEEIFLVTSCYKNRDTWLVCKLNTSGHKRGERQGATFYGRNPGDSHLKTDGDARRKFQKTTMGRQDLVLWDGSLKFFLRHTNPKTTNYRRKASRCGALFTLRETKSNFLPLKVNQVLFIQKSPRGWSDGETNMAIVKSDLQRVV